MALYKYRNHHNGNAWFLILEQQRLQASIYGKIKLVNCEYNMS